MIRLILNREALVGIYYIAFMMEKSVDKELAIELYEV